MDGWKRRLAIGVGVLVGAPLLICAVTGVAGLLLDGTLTLEAVEVLPAPPEAVYDHLDDAEDLAAWWGAAMEDYAAANGGAPLLQVVHVEGTPPAGVGCRVDFVANGVTAETWEILALDPNREVRYDIDFKVIRVERTLRLEPDGAGTRMTWTETGTIGNPWMRLMTRASGTEGAEANFRDAMRALGKVASR